MAGRRSVWSAPAVQELAASFVPAADEAHFLKVMRGAEGDLFRAVAEKGHYAGRTVPTSTRQGIYAVDDIVVRDRLVPTSRASAVRTPG